MNEPCLACGGGLTIAGESATCSRTSCEGQRLFARCPYCRQWSTALRRGNQCLNRNCAAYAREREACRECRAVPSIMTLGRKVCVNRNCPTNAAILAECAFCRNRSFLESPDLMFCTKSTCPCLFRRVEVCHLCTARSFVVQQESCANPECAASGAVMDLCTACGRRTQRRSPPGAPCANPSCSRNKVEKSETRTFRKAGKNEPKTAIEAAYALLRGRFLDAGPVKAPLVLVIGLTGSGKTTYLSMLGDILYRRRDRYWFPFDIRAERVEVDALLEGYDGPFADRVADHIRDLVYDFGLPNSQNFVSRQLWPPLTAVSEEDTAFLVTRLVGENDAPVAKIVTLETYGEAYEKMLRGIRGRAPRTPGLEHALSALLTDADGFVVLLDPDPTDPLGNDDSFCDLFMLLKDELRPRAFNVFFQEMKRLIEAGAAPPKNPRELHAWLRREQDRQAAFIAQAEELHAKTRSRLERLDKQLAGAPVDISKLDDGRWLLELESFLQRDDRFAKNVALGREHVTPTPGLADDELLFLLHRYYKGFVQFCLDNVKDIVGRRLLRDQDPETRSVMTQLQQRFGLSDDFIRRIEKIEPQSFNERPVNRFKSLRQLSLVVTKADRWPIIYPPEDYPRQRLPNCHLHLRELEDYLKLCGGSVRYYNASATGFTSLVEGADLPAPANAQTPINVLEPIFDMLGITE